MRLRLARLIAFPLALMGPLALSHIYIVSRGVHFKGGKVDFGMPPSRYGNYWFDSMNSFDAWRPGTDYLAVRDYDDWEESERRDAIRAKRELAAYRKARGFEQEGQYAQALATYRSMLRNGWGDIAPIRRHVEILKAVGGRSALGLPELLSAESILRKGAPKTLPTEYDPRLAIFVAYEEADRLAAAKNYSLAGAKLYLAARQNPKGPWVEECLIMAARNVLQEAAKPTLDDQHIADASLRLLLANFPKSRFRNNAYAWLGRIDYLNRRPAEAIHHYRTWARLAESTGEKAQAYESIAATYTLAGRKEDAAAWLLRRFDLLSGYEKQSAMTDFRSVVDTFRGATSRRFWQILAGDQDLLGNYLEYRIDLTYPTDDLLRLGRPKLTAKDEATLSPHVLAKLAEISLRMNRPAEAHRFAVKAISHRAKNDDADLSSFVLGTLAMRKGRFLEARTFYRRIANRKQAGYLAGGAKENLAIIAERTGNLPEALDLYDDLGYDQDFAYLADARMTTRQLAAYVRRPHARRKSVLVYTLGMRYLRDGKWNRAEATFARLTNQQRRKLTAPGFKWGFDWVRDQGGLQDPKATLKALRHLENAAKRARGSEAKAQAMLDMANYYYSHRYLLLYSIPLWLGERANSIAYSWNGDVATKADDLALARHHDEHECFAHTLAICREIVRKYPRTKAAAHAAYRGACAAERLANMSQYMRWQGARRDLLGESVVLLRKAAVSKEPELARKARKYKQIFADEREEKRAAFATEGLPTRRWDPRW